MNCKELTTSQVCFLAQNGDRTSLVAHYEYGTNAADAVLLAATYFTNAAGVVVDTAGGIVTVGVCQVAQPDVEWQELCDVQADGTVVRFMCRVVTYFQPDGQAVTPNITANFAMNKIDVYAPTGTVGACGNDCTPATARGVQTAWAA